MTVFSYCLLSYLLFALESPLLAELGLALYAPDLSVPLLLAVALRLGTTELLVFACLAGLILDGFMPLTPLGLHAERMVVLAYATRGFFLQARVRTMSGKVVVGMALSLLSDFILLVLLALFDRSFDSHALIFQRMVPHALLTGLAVPLVDWLVATLTSRLRLRKDAIFYS